eukprot:gene5835-8051_t
MVRAIIGLIFCSVILIIGGFITKPKILLNASDRVLIIGDTNTMHGTMMDQGFVKLIENALFLNFSNITVFGFGIKDTNNFELLKKLEENILTTFNPTKVIFIIGNDEIENISDKIISISDVRFGLESIIASLVVENIQTIVCGILVHGENILDASPHGEALEEYMWIAKQVAKDYGAMYIDLYSPFIKYLENTNHENLPHAVLTHDGKILNEAGHLLLAITILHELEIRNHTLLRDNILSQEIRRVQQLKTENLEVYEYDLTYANDFSSL